MLQSMFVLLKSCLEAPFLGAAPEIRLGNGLLCGGTSFVLQTLPLRCPITSQVKMCLFPRGCPDAVESASRGANGSLPALI